MLTELVRTVANDWLFKVMDNISGISKAGNIG
jgi:hypothetical protein